MKKQIALYFLRYIISIMFAFTATYLVLFLLALMVLLIQCVYKYGDGWKNCFLFTFCAMWWRCLYSFVFMFIFILVTVSIPVSIRCFKLSKHSIKKVNSVNEK